MLRSSFQRRPRPDGRWSLAHPLHQPVRFIAQSLIAWPAAAFAAMMMAAPESGFAHTQISLMALQVTFVYPLIALAAFGLYFGLAKAGLARISPIPLIVPIAIVGVWLVTLALFLAKFVASAAGLL